MRSLLNALPAFLIRAGPDMDIRYLNRYAEGFEPSTTVGRDTYEYLAAEHRDLARARVAEVLKTGQPQRYQLRGQGDHGRLVDYETIIAPVAEVDGRRGLIFLFTGEDVSDDDLKLVDGLLSKPVPAERLLGTLASVRSKKP